MASPLVTGGEAFFLCEVRLMAKKKESLKVTTEEADLIVEALACYVLEKVERDGYCDERCMIAVFLANRLRNR